MAQQCFATKRQSLTKQTILSRHFLSVNNLPVTSFLFSFSFFTHKFLPLSACHMHLQHILQSDHMLWTTAKCQNKVQMIFLIYILTDFSKRRTTFYVNYLLQVCLTNTTLFTSLNQPCPSWSFTIYNAYMLFVQLLYDVQLYT